MNFDSLLHSIKTLGETEWIELKCNYAEPEEIGQYISAISNSASLNQKDRGWIVWGINDSNQIVGTSFNPRRAKKGAEELENWLGRLISPGLDFRFHEIFHKDKRIIVLEVPAATHTPIRFKDSEWVRIGTYKKKLHEYPEKERALWLTFERQMFEQGLALAEASLEELSLLLDIPTYFKSMHLPVPDDPSSAAIRLYQEKLIQEIGSGHYNVTNLGAILFAKSLDSFESLSRKRLRVIIYQGNNRTQTKKEIVGNRGYASGFEGLIKFVNQQLPTNEQIGQALRREVKVYPEIAIRELVANALIHQDFSMTGTGPTIEVFNNRIEITNPGIPLIDPLRFIDEPPQSRNEALAAFMRRLRICEERGSGIDKVVAAVEFYQLPAPNFEVTPNHTRVTLYGPEKLIEMDKIDRIRACYQHACLCFVSNQSMTNATLRKRFGIQEQNAATASRIISDTLKTKLIKAKDPSSTSKKQAQYVPFWA